MFYRISNKIKLTIFTIFLVALFTFAYSVCFGSNKNIGVSTNAASFFVLDNSLVRPANNIWGFELSKGLSLVSSTPYTASNTLYNLSGKLYWDGAEVGGGSITETDPIWTAASTSYFWLNHNNTSTGLTNLATTTFYGDAYGQNLNFNEGMVSDPTIIDATGVTVNVSSADVLIRSDSTWDGDQKLYRKTVPASTTLAMSNDTLNYIYVDWNNGSPIYKSTLNRNIVDNSDIIPVARVYMEGGDIEYKLINGYWGRSLAVRNLDRVMRTRGIGGIEKEPGTGLVLSEVATSKINITAGYAWFGMTRETLNPITQNTTNTEMVYHTGGNWTSITLPTYNNTWYDSGSATSTLTNNHYAVNCIWRNLSKEEIDFTIGSGDYSLSQAQASTCVTPPDSISAFYVLVGRIIVKKGDSTATQIDQIGGTAFSFSGLSSHPDLLNLDYASSGHTGFAGTSVTNTFSQPNYFTNVYTSGNLQVTGTLNVVGASTFGSITSGTWAGTIIGNIKGGTGKDTSGWTGFTKLSSGVWSTSTISLTSDVTGLLPLANFATGTLGYVLMAQGNSSPIWVSTSSLGISGGTGTSVQYGTTTFSATTTVTVDHNFGNYPIVQVLDSSNNVLIPDTIHHDSENTFTVNFGIASTGTIIYMSK